MSRKAFVALLGVVVVAASVVVATYLLPRTYRLPAPEKIVLSDSPFGQLLHATEQVSLNGRATLNPGTYELPMATETATVSVAVPTQLKATVAFSILERSTNPFAITPRVENAAFRFSPAILVKHPSGVEAELSSVSFERSTQTFAARIDPIVAATLTNLVVRLFHAPAAAADLQPVAGLVQEFTIEHANVALHAGESLRFADSRLCVGTGCVVELRDVQLRADGRSGGEITAHLSLQKPSVLSVRGIGIVPESADLALSGTYAVEPGMFAFATDDRPASIEINGGALDVGQDKDPVSLHLAVKHLRADFSQLKGTIDTKDQGVALTFCVRDADVTTASDSTLRVGETMVTIAASTAVVRHQNDDSSSPVLLNGTFPSVQVSRPRVGTLGASDVRTSLRISLGETPAVEGDFESTTLATGLSPQLDAILHESPLRLAGLQLTVKDGHAVAWIPHCEIRVPKAKLLAEVEKLIPNEVSLPDYSLGDKAIYREMKFTNVRVSGVRPRLVLDGERFGFTASATLSADLHLKYHHIVIGKEKTRLKTKNPFPIGGEWIIIDGPEVPKVTVDEWRPRGPLRNSLQGTAQGEAMLSLTQGDSLADQRIRLNIQCSDVQITAAKLDTGDAAGPIASALLPAASAIDPWNNAIRAQLSRSIELFPFDGLPAQTREVLKHLSLSDVSFRADPNDVVFAGRLMIKG